MRARVRVLSATYRGNGGFLISGRDTLNRRVRVFVFDRESATKVVDNIKAGKHAFEDVTA